MGIRTVVSNNGTVAIFRGGIEIELRDGVLTVCHAPFNGRQKALVVFHNYGADPNRCSIEIDYVY